MPDAAAATARSDNRPMPQAGKTVPKTAGAAAVPNRVTELKVSGHLMTLDTGLFCVFQPPGSPAAGANGLPGVRLSLPPNPQRRPDAVRISTFREDGWMPGGDGAALVRVTEGPAQVLVTVYQLPGSPPEAAPRLQVLRLTAEAAAQPAVNLPRPIGAAAPASVADMDIVAHVQRTGDVGGSIGEWIGVSGSRLWIEGFGINPRNSVAAEDIEYQAVLGRGWLSPWVEGGKFCGSRGMALPLLGIRVRLKGAAAKTHELTYSASFVDGTRIGPVSAGEPCEADSLASLEAFQVALRPRQGGKGASGTLQPDSAKVESMRRPARRAN